MVYTVIETNERYLDRTHSMINNPANSSSPENEDFPKFRIETLSYLFDLDHFELYSQFFPREYFSKTEGLARRFDQELNSLGDDISELDENMPDGFMNFIEEIEDRFEDEEGQFAKRRTSRRNGSRFFLKQLIEKNPEKNHKRRDPFDSLLKKHWNDIEEETYSYKGWRRGIEDAIEKRKRLYNTLKNLQREEEDIQKEWARNYNIKPTWIEIDEWYKS